MKVCETTLTKATQEEEKYRQDVQTMNIYGEKLHLVPATPNLVSFYYDGNDTLVVDIHGGGFCFKHPIDNDAYCHYLNNTYCVSVLNVDYSPSYKWGFPVQLIEISEQVKNLLRKYPSKSRLILVGHSSGGNLACALCLKWLRENGPKVTALLLDYPFLDLSRNPSSRPFFPNSPSSWPNSLLDDWVNLYCPSVASRTNPLVSPLFMDKKDVKDFSPTYIVGCVVDRLQEDAKDFAALLKSAKVPYRYFEANERHGFIERQMQEIYRLPNDPNIRYAKSVVDQEIIYALTLKR